MMLAACPVEVLGGGERGDRFGVGGEAGAVVLNDAAAFQKLVDADAAAESRGGVGRQAVARPRDVGRRRRRGRTGR